MEINVYFSKGRERTLKGFVNIPKSGDVIVCEGRREYVDEVEYDYDKMEVNVYCTTVHPLSKLNFHVVQEKI